MDTTSMDDKLYYVESPDGQVLGPMNMIHILEGIAAGMILDSARICEVGRQEWITLTDVAYTRDDERGGSPEDQLEELAASDLDLSDPFEAPAGHHTEEIPLGAPMSPRSAPPEDPEEVTVPTQQLFDLETGSEPAPGFEESWAPTPAADPPPELYDSAQETHAVPPATGEPTEGAGDFHLSIPVEETETPPSSEEEVTGENRRRWAIPTAIAVAVPVIAGVYFMVGNKIPFLEGRLNPPASVSTPAETDAEDGSAPSLKRAWAVLSSGQTDQALAEFRRAVVEEPENPEAHHGLGRAALASGEIKLAMKHLERAANIDPNEVVYVLDLGQAQLGDAQPDLAAKTAQHVLSMAPDEPRGHRLLGSALAATDDPAGAAKELAKYLEAEPADDEARRELAYALSRTGRLEPAVGEIDRYLVGNADDREAQSARLEWMLASGQIQEAGLMYGALAAKNPQSAYHQYLAGLAYPNSEDGIRFLLRAIEIDPEHGDAHATLGRYYAKLGRRDEAMASLKRAFEIRPGSAEERALLADFQKQQEPAGVPKPAPPEKKATVAEAKPVPAKQPAASKGSEVGPWVAKVREELDRARFETARSLIESARANLSGDPTAERNLDLWAAIIDFEEGKFEAALQRFEALDPDVSYSASGWGKGAVRNWIARTYIAQGDVRSAVAELDQIGTEDANEYATARLWEGVILSSLGMSELADRTWNRIAVDVGKRVGPEGRAAMKSAQFLAGSISEKDYRTAVAPVKNFENDMHFFLGHAARLGHANDLARAHFSKSVESSSGHEFPFHLAQSEVAGE